MRILIVIALALTACAPSNGYASLPQDPGRVVRIEMSDFAFSPATITVKPGERITLAFRNIGKLEHEFMAGREAMVGTGFMQDWLALAKTEGASGGHGGGHVGEGLRLAPSTATNVTLVVPPDVGQFEFACFVVGHYESGMKGMLFVDAGVAPNAVPTVAPTPTARPTAMPMGSMGDEDAEAH